MRKLQQYERQLIPGHAVPTRHSANGMSTACSAFCARQDGVLLVATRDGALCGFGAGYVDDDPEARSLNFYIAQLPSPRRRADSGSDRLIDAMEDAARERGLATIVIGVLAASERVHRLYDRLGYHDRDPDAKETGPAGVSERVGNETAA